jgi:hypothetical protein
MMALRLAQVAITGLALLVLIVTPSPMLVERYFARGLYPRLQQWLTSWSNQTGVALFDFITVALALVGLGLVVHAVRGAMRARSVRPLFRGGWVVVWLGAIVYLWFLVAWGLNYARPPLETTLPYEPANVTSDGVRRLAQRAVDEVNRLHASGHAHGFPASAEMPPALVQSFHGVERRLGRPLLTVPSRPKRTVFATFFRAAGVDGMHAPFLLETLLNPDSWASLPRCAPIRRRSTQPGWRCCTKLWRCSRATSSNAYSVRWPRVRDAIGPPSAVGNCSAWNWSRGQAGARTTST